MSAGHLVVCPTPIGNLEDVTLRVLAALREADIVACEDTRRTRTLLERYGVTGTLVSYHEHTERERAARVIEAKLHGQIDISGCGDVLLCDVAGHVDDHGDDALRDEAGAVTDHGHCRAVGCKQRVSEKARRFTCHRCGHQGATPGVQGHEVDGDRVARVKAECHGSLGRIATNRHHHAELGCVAVSHHAGVAGQDR